MTHRRYQYQNLFEIETRISAALLAILLLVLLFSAGCSGEGGGPGACSPTDPSCGPSIVLTPPPLPPVYGRWISPEPNWCAYQTGDRVGIRYADYVTPGQPLTVVAWFPTREGDPAGRLFDSYVVRTDGRCVLMVFP